MAPTAQVPPRARSHTLIGVAPPPAPAPIAGRLSMPSLAIDAEPTVLLVGDGFPAAGELEQALAAHGIYCESASADVAAYTAVAVAPDIVLLVGDAAGERHAALNLLLKNALGERMPPVAVVLPKRDLSSRLDAFRRGAVAAFEASDGAEPLASKVAQLIADLTKRGVYAGALVGEASLEELLAALSKELRAELCDDQEARSGPVRLVLGGGKPLAIALHEFVGRVKRHVVSATPLSADAEEPPNDEAPVASSRRAELLPEPLSRPPGDISGMRMLLVDDDAGRADIVAQALRARGATVLVSSLAPSRPRLQRLRRLDPMVLLAGDDHIPGPGLTLLREVRDDYRLRWASLLVLRWSEVWPDEADAPAIEPLLGTLAALSELEHAAEGRAAAGLSFDVRLESIGPIRLLRALGACQRPVRIHVENPRMEVDVDLQRGLVERASARSEDGPELFGVDALSALSVLHSGRVSVEPNDEPKASARLGTLDELLAKMDGLSPPVAPSLFPEALGSVLPASFGTPAVPAELVVAEPPLALPVPEHSPLEPSPTRVPKLPRSIPLWVVVLGLLGIFAALITSLVSPRRDESIAAPSTAAAASGKQAENDTESARSPHTGGSLIERAQRGDDAALQALEQIPADRRSVEQALALAQGKTLQRKREVAEWLSELREDPAQLRESNTRRKLIAAARDPVTGSQTLQGIAAIDAPESTDLIYEVWTGTRGKSPLTELAESLVFSDAVRRRASPALAVALDLRTLDSCEAAKQAVGRASGQGDKRALVPLARLVSRRGCGPRKLADCYPCLRGDTSLRKALAAVRKRPAP